MHIFDAYVNVYTSSNVIHTGTLPEWYYHSETVVQVHYFLGIFLFNIMNRNKTKRNQHQKKRIKENAKFYRKDKENHIWSHWIFRGKRNSRTAICQSRHAKLQWYIENEKLPRIVCAKSIVENENRNIALIAMEKSPHFTFLWSYLIGIKF